MNQKLNDMKKVFLAIALGAFVVSCGGNDETNQRTPEQIEADKNMDRLMEIMKENDEIGEEIVDIQDHIIRLKKINPEEDVSEHEKEIEVLKNEQLELEKEMDNM